MPCENGVKGRIACTDLGDTEAAALFEMSLPQPKSVTDILPYKQLNFRRRACWSDVCKHRGFLGDVSAASHGFLLRLRCLQAQLSSWATKNAVRVSGRGRF